MTEKDKSNIVESLTTAVLITDNDFSIVYANTAAEQLCGISRTRLKHTNAVDLIDKTEESLLNALQEINFKNNFQGFSAADVLISPFPGKSSKADLSIFHYAQDTFEGLIIELHPIAHQERLIKQVQQNNQYTAARDLIRNLAHEIKNPLGGIRGAAQLIEMSYSNKVEGLNDYTKVIIEQTDRLKVLVNNLLGPQRPKPLELVNIHFLIEKVLKLIMLQKESSKVKIIKDYDPSLPELMLDTDSIEQVLINIINNAIQALTDSNTKDPMVVIKTRASIRTIVGNKKYPISMIVSISNNGPQIPENIKQTVFYPMVTSKVNGNGLGLSIALNIVERHNGTIECLSDAHETSFKIVLPIKSGIHGEN